MPSRGTLLLPLGGTTVALCVGLPIPRSGRGAGGGLNGASEGVEYSCSGVGYIIERGLLKDR